MVQTLLKRKGRCNDGFVLRLGDFATLADVGKLVARLLRDFDTFRAVGDFVAGEDSVLGGFRHGCVASGVSTMSLGQRT